MEILNWARAKPHLDRTIKFNILPPFEPLRMLFFKVCDESCIKRSVVIRQNGGMLSLRRIRVTRFHPKTVKAEMQI